MAEHAWPATPSRHWLTLAPCAPDCAQLDAEECYYQPLVRFGRHGNIAVRLGAPFKRPLLLIDTGALLATRQQTTLTYHGKGLGGRSSPLSFAIDATVHQGYAPLVPLTLERPQ
jgi:CRISPR-associated protein Csm4